MYKNTFFAILIVLCLTVSLPADDVAKHGAEVGKWTMDLDAATRLAKHKNLPLLLDFTGSDWCYWCQLMQKSVFSKKEWSDYAADKLVLVTIDFPQNKKLLSTQLQERNRKLAEKYGVNGFPTYVIFDSDGATELGRLGAGRDKTPATFQKEVESILRLRPAAIDAKVASLSPDQGKKYRQLIDDLLKSKKALEDWLETRPQRTPENFAKFNKMNEDIQKIEETLDKF